MIISAVGSLISVVFGSFEGILVGRASGHQCCPLPLLVGIAREVVPARACPF
jgi:hypothetical protein